jgi:hypothetical protein
MTREEILNIPAGREMDKLIAERITKLKGIKWSSYCPIDWIYHHAGGLGWSVIPFYSTNISAAWQVVEKLNEKWSVRVISYYQSDCLANIWDVKNFDKSYMARADTVPLALCRAALLAVNDA